MSQATGLAVIRTKIDAIDQTILDLIGQRAKCAVEAKVLKGSAKIYRPSRETEIKTKAVANKAALLPTNSVVAIFTEIVAACRNLEQQLSISYLGPAGTYSHEAAVKMFGSSSDFRPHVTLSEVLKAAQNDACDIAFLPIENSTEGGIIETHRFLLSTDLEISGEYTLPIKHCLISDAKSLKTITSVHAHPQALGQCREWLQLQLPHAKLIPEASNAQAALAVRGNTHAAAIASQQASSLVGVAVLVKGINDFPGNKTRFIALSRFKPAATGHDKTSIICSVKDGAGALNHLLSILAGYSINLLRLESQPHADHDYVFYIDFQGHLDDPNVTAALAELTPAAKTCKILGSYPIATP